MADIVREEWTKKVIFDTLHEQYGVLKNGAKLLADAAGATPRAAENWLAR